ncbi:hypothetical protein [Actinokineospora enzanensis]|uniref:hypothetical protein n=1 Tax=Actinokineospora enzanensis TaxID=155975 RepID=UPI0003653DF7|nr:hypothetical protein [Actinokineospora enzanensis]
MDRPSTGRRRVRSGSVRVTELIRRQPTLPVTPAHPDGADGHPTESIPRIGPAPRADTMYHRTEPIRRLAHPPTEVTRTLPVVLSAPIADPDLDAEQAEAGSAAEPVGFAHDHEPPSRTAQLAKLTGLGVAAVTLCAAVAAAGIIARDRSGGQAADRPSVEITGGRALLPHELDRAVTTAALDGPASADILVQSTGAASGTLVPDQQARATSGTRRDGRDRADSDTSPAHSGHVSERGLTSSRDLVLDYYRLAGTEPRSAFDLVAGDLLGTSLGEFVGSWRVVTGVEVLSVTERSDGVLAVIRLHLRDGSHLRAQQLLKVSNTVPQRIVGAQLVSAQLD